MKAKLDVVVEKGIKGLVLNPWKRELAEGKQYPVSKEHAKAIMLAAQESGIDSYVSRLAEGKRVGMKGNNKVFAPKVRAILKNQAQPAPQQSNTQTEVLVLDSTPSVDYEQMEAKADFIEFLTSKGVSKADARRKAEIAFS